MWYCVGLANQLIYSSCRSVCSSPTETTIQFCRMRTRILHWDFWLEQIASWHWRGRMMMVAVFNIMWILCDICIEKMQTEKIRWLRKFLWNLLLVNFIFHLRSVVCPQLWWPVGNTTTATLRQLGFIHVWSIRKGSRQVYLLPKSHWASIGGQNFGRRSWHKNGKRTIWPRVNWITCRNPISNYRQSWWLSVLDVDRWFVLHSMHRSMCGAKSKCMWSKRIQMQ